MLLLLSPAFIWRLQDWLEHVRRSSLDHMMVLLLLLDKLLLILLLLLLLQKLLLLLLLIFHGEILL